MKKINHSIIIAVLLFCLAFSPQAFVMAKEDGNAAPQAAVQTSSGNPNTGIAEKVGTGAVLLLAGGGSLAGTVMLKKYHNEQIKKENRHC